MSQPMLTAAARAMRTRQASVYRGLDRNVSVWSTERWRWLPFRPGRRRPVRGVPGYELSASGRIALTHVATAH